MSEFFAMGGYGGYVWATYAVFLIVLAIDAVAPVWQRRRALRELGNRLKRQAARNSR
jgi:heme exporter protein D